MAAPELERDSYDVVVMGTGLAESIAAAALAKAGKTVLHLDPNDYYAAAQASLTLDELVNWTRDHSSASSSRAHLSYSHATASPITPELDNNRRRYALSLFPAVLPSRGELIDTLIKSDVSKYVSFRMLDSVSIWQPDEAATTGLRRVPGSKEEVFKDKSVSLMEKRRLMKFLMFAAAQFEDDELLKGKEDVPLKVFLEETFSLPPHLSLSVMYAIAHCSYPGDLTLPALVRTRRYLRSVGRYGSGAFLVGQYGGAGEVAQGFCRACAVHGGTYVLGPSAAPTSLDISNTGIELQIPCHPLPVSASYLISNPSHLPASQAASAPATSIARCIAVLDTLREPLRRPKRAEEQSEEGEKGEDDTAVVVFPPETEDGSAVRALLMGEGTGSCPQGQFTLYLSGAADPSSDPKEILEPYLHRLSPKPLFEAYYLSHHTASLSIPGSVDASRVVKLDAHARLDGLTEGLDWEAEQGRKAYEAVMRRTGGEAGFFEKTKEDGEGEGEEDADGDLL